MAEKKSTPSTRKKTINAAKTEEIKEVKVNNSAEDELKKVQSENNMLSEMLKKMQEQIDALQKQQTKESDGNTVVIKQNSDLTRTVKVVSLLPNVYNLSTQPYGKGKVYQFNKFGDSHMIKFNDMQDILGLYVNQFEKGYAVLTNKQDYEDLGVGYIYDEVLNQEKVEKLIKLESKDAVNTIVNMDDDMAEKIIGVIANKIADGYTYDYNKIKALEDNGFQVNELVEIVEASRQKQSD